MTKFENDSSSDNNENTPKKRGPKPSGVSRAEIQARASKLAREKQLSRGLVEMKTFVTPETKAKLADLKIDMGKLTVGEVIDELIKIYSDKYVK